MTVTFKKAGETVAKNAVKAVTGPRAVSASEAASVQPGREASSKSMMPWRGWVESFLQDKLGQENFDKYRKLIYYRPDDIHDMEQIPRPATKVPISKDDPNMTAQFRYPSPGSQGPVRMPQFEAGEDPYDTSYYKRDTGRRGLDPAFRHPELEAIKLELLDENDPDVKEMKEQLAEPASSPGNKGNFATGPSDYDPTGLRATMSANHAALNESLDANMPDHLPYPDWWDKQEEVVAWYTERDLPVPIGATGWGTIPRAGRVARW